jgi:hypothetical protein
MAKLRSIAMMQIDSIKDNKIIPVTAIIGIDCNRLACCDQSVAINRSIAISQIDGKYKIYSDLTNKLDEFYIDDSYDFDASIRSVLMIPEIMMFRFDPSVEINWLQSIH